MKSRIVYIFLALLTLWSLMIFRAVNLQLLPNEKLQTLKKRQFRKLITINSRRGAVTDRNGKELAVTTPSYSLFADPKLIKNPKKVSRLIQKKLGIKSGSTYKKIKSKKKRFAWIKRNLNKHQMLKIKKEKIKGLSFIEEPLRVYPNNNLLSQVLGFVGSENKGLEGIELKFDQDLKGESKQIKLRKDARGRPLLLNGQLFMDKPEGANIELTVDSELQFYIQKELERATKEHDADSAIAVVLDANTSEILGMSNYPDYNLNNPGRYASSSKRNRAVTDAFEQGSTLKTFVVASALKNKVAQPNKKYDCEGGVLKIGRRYIRDSHPDPKEKWLTVSEILAKSSNVGIAKVAFDLGRDRLRNTLVDFGFGQKLGVDLPGEARGILKKQPWGKHLLSNIAFGHGITATPLQVAAAYAAIANGGTLNKPYIVKSIYNTDSGEKKDFGPQEIRKVLSSEEASTLRLMLNAVTGKSGTGYTARVKGFPVAGKTGTAQKVDLENGGYYKAAYISSFVGFFPTNSPKYVIYVAVDNPKKQYYGTIVAAPSFSKIAQFLVRKDGLTPYLLSDKDLLSSEKGKKVALKQRRAVGKLLNQSMNFSETGWKRVPNFMGLSLREVLVRTQGAPVKISVHGSGRVSKVWPEIGDEISSQQTIKLQLTED